MHALQRQKSRESYPLPQVRVRGIENEIQGKQDRLNDI
jgi:hypothetical protein